MLPRGRSCAYWMIFSFAFTHASPLSKIWMSPMGMCKVDAMLRWRFYTPAQQLKTPHPSLPRLKGMGYGVIMGIGYGGMGDEGGMGYGAKTASDV